MTVSPAFDHKTFLQKVSTSPGVYKMIDEAGDVLYVGKAKNLKNRLSSYFRTGSAGIKQKVMVSRISSIETIITATENEALLLECQLIKSLKPRYNICLRDDKSYPYIYISTHQKFPRITVHRGARSRQGRYFGPYSSVGAVRESLGLLQKVFPVRQCEDSFFRNRSRPCLQYQIERCSAPCTNFISESDYKQDVERTIMFLEGKGGRLIDELVGVMQSASGKLDFEQAALCRDRITMLRKVLEKQYVSGARGDLDIIACFAKENRVAVQLFFIREGQQVGGQVLYPRASDRAEEKEILSAFIAQYYTGKIVPKELLVSHEPDEKQWLESVLSEQSAHKVTIKSRVRGDRAKWLKMAQDNAEKLIKNRLVEKERLTERYAALQAALKLEFSVQRMECFDISHTQGEKTVASCVVFDSEGPLKSAYRRFNIEGITPGDDYAALAQAVHRRFRRIKQGEYRQPDILIIDGGKGQLNSVTESLTRLEISDIIVLGISKGPDRKAGSEQLYRAGEERPLDLDPESSGFHLIQMIRDEAHRFAITGHRARRGKTKKESVLEQIPGLGPKRRQKLLQQFGGLQNVREASVESLQMIEGISRQLAEKIYGTFHETN